MSKERELMEFSHTFNNGRKYGEHETFSKEGIAITVNDMVSTTSNCRGSNNNKDGEFVAIVYETKMDSNPQTKIKKRRNEYNQHIKKFQDRKELTPIVLNANPKFEVKSTKFQS